MNIAIVQGSVRAEPDVREAADGDQLVSFDVMVEGDGPTQQVPISWRGRPTHAPTVAEGAVVTVVGPVIRRFYRSGGATVSRTDVRADRIVKGAGRRAEAAIAEAIAASGVD